MPRRKIPRDRGEVMTPSTSANGVCNNFEESSISYRQSSSENSQDGALVINEPSISSPQVKIKYEVVDISDDEHETSRAPENDENTYWSNKRSKEDVTRSKSDKEELNERRNNDIKLQKYEQKTREQMMKEQEELIRRRVQEIKSRSLKEGHEKYTQEEEQMKNGKQQQQKLDQQQMVDKYDQLQKQQQRIIEQNRQHQLQNQARPSTSKSTGYDNNPGSTSLQCQPLPPNRPHQPAASQSNFGISSVPSTAFLTHLNHNRSPNIITPENYSKVLNAKFEEFSLFIKKLIADYDTTFISHAYAKMWASEYEVANSQQQPQQQQQQQQSTPNNQYPALMQSYQQPGTSTQDQNGRDSSNYYRNYPPQIPPHGGKCGPPAYPNNSQHSFPYLQHPPPPLGPTTAAHYPTAHTGIVHNRIPGPYPPPHSNSLRAYHHRPTSVIHYPAPSTSTADNPSVSTKPPTFDPAVVSAANKYSNQTVPTHNQTSPKSTEEFTINPKSRKDITITPIEMIPLPGESAVSSDKTDSSLSKSTLESKRTTAMPQSSAYMVGTKNSPAHNTHYQAQELQGMQAFFSSSKRQDSDPEMPSTTAKEKVHPITIITRL